MLQLNKTEFCEECYLGAIKNHSQCVKVINALADRLKDPTSEKMDKLSHEMFINFVYCWIFRSKQVDPVNLENWYKSLNEFDENLLCEPRNVNTEVRDEIFIKLMNDFSVDRVVLINVAKRMISYMDDFCENLKTIKEEELPLGCYIKSIDALRFHMIRTSKEYAFYVESIQERIKHPEKAKKEENIAQQSN